MEMHIEESYPLQVGDIVQGDTCFENIQSKQSLNISWSPIATVDESVDNWRKDIWSIGKLLRKLVGGTGFEPVAPGL